MLTTADQESVTVELPAPTTVRPETEFGVWFGVTADEATEAAPKPMQFDAATLKTYEVPLVRPFTTCDVPDAELVKMFQVEPLFDE